RGNSPYARRPHTRRTAHAHEELRIRSGDVSLLVGDLREGRKQARRVERRRKLVPASHQRAGGNHSPHAAPRLVATDDSPWSADNPRTCVRGYEARLQFALLSSATTRPSPATTRAVRS